MNIASTTAVQSATANVQASTADEVNVRILKKALDAQALEAATLVQSLPEPPALATDGSVGTQVNTFV